MKRNFFKDTSPLKKGITIILAIIFLANVILMIAGFQHTILIVITLEIPIVYMIVCFIQDIKKSKFSTPDLTLRTEKTLSDGMELNQPHTNLRKVDGKSK